MRLLVFIILSFLFLTEIFAGEVAGSRRTPARPAGPKRLCKEVTSKSLKGKASRYANNLVGRPTACKGVPFSQHLQTASIKRTGKSQRSMLLPCGTIVRVTRTDRKGANGLPLTQDVVITDNGTLETGRIIDLTNFTAGNLEYGPLGGGGGTIQVKLEVCKPY